MEAFRITAESVIPVFLIILCGMFARYKELLSEKDASMINRLVFRIFLPVSIARSIYRAEGTMPRIGYFVFLLIFFVLLFLFSRFFAFRISQAPNQNGVIMQALCRSNYTLLGYALALSLFPDGDGGIAALIVTISIPVHSILAVLSFELSSKKVDKRGLIKRILMNPLMIGCYFGLLIKLLPFELPVLLDTTVQKIGSIASPLALFAIGAAINVKKVVTNAKVLGFTVLVRLVLIPVVSLSALYIFGFRGPEFAAFLCYVGSPTAVSSCPTAAEMGGDMELAVQIVTFTTLISGLTLFVFIFLSKSLGAF